MNEPRVIVALDFADETSTLQLVDQLQPEICRLKVGKELFTRCGPALVRQLVTRGFDVFLDLKYHDIPNTVARACEAAADLGVWMLNVHALGGPAMLAAARAALSGSDSPRLIAVTILTSSNASDLAAVGIHESPQQMVLKLAALSQQAGLDGVVCSAQEAGILKQHHGNDFVLVTPGIRPANAGTDDQSRVMTPAEAIRQGSHYLVIGRPVTRAADPVRILTTINSEISEL